MGQSGFCSRCGQVLGENSRYCLFCGAPFALSPNPYRRPIHGRKYSKSLTLAASGLGLIALAILSGLWLSGALSGSSGGIGDQDPGKPALGDPNSHSPEWFASYRDAFLSAPTIVYTKEAAEKRNFPTIRGTMRLGTTSVGTMLDGRYVAGGDGPARWLKTTDGAYISSVALSVTPLLVEGVPGNGFAVSNIRFGRTLQPDGQLADLVPDHVYGPVPATVNFQLDYANAVPFQAYACQLRGQSRAAIMAQYGVLQAPSGWIRCGFNITSPGIYEAVLGTANANFWLGNFRITNPSGE